MIEAIKTRKNCQYGKNKVWISGLAVRIDKWKKKETNQSVVRLAFSDRED